MPLDTERVDLADERERLRGEMEETAEEQVQWASEAHSDGSQEYLVALQKRGNTLRDYRTILEWAQDPDEGWGIDAVEIAGLSVGEINRAEDFVDEHDGVRRRDALVAVGTVDAPYVAHDPDEITDEDFEQTVMNLVSDVPLPFVRWAEERIGDKSYLESDVGNEYTKLLLEAKSRMEDGESG